jgi:DNA/RNA endonuclease G (NUC1)
MTRRLKSHGNDRQKQFGAAAGLSLVSLVSLALGAGTATACDQTLFPFSGVMAEPSLNSARSMLCLNDNTMTAVWAQHSFVLDDVLGNDGQPYAPDDRTQGEDNRQYNRTYTINGHRVVRNYQGYPFRISRQVAPYNIALPIDYSNNPDYIRGLLVGRDFVPNTPAFQQRVLTMTNTLPMSRDFKETKWTQMDVTALNMLKSHPGTRVFTVSGALYDPTLTRMENGRIVNNVDRRVAIPDAYFRLYYIEKTQSMYALMVPRKDDGRSLKHYVLPVDEVERLSGYDFFSWVDDSTEIVQERNVGYIKEYLPNHGREHSNEPVDLGKAIMSIFK